MDLFKEIRNKAYELFEYGNRIPRFEQYMHLGACKMPCKACGQYYYRLYEVGKSKPPVGEENHPKCDCFYYLVQQLLAGTISLK